MSGAPVVDARGLRCPLPVIRLAAAAREGAPGDVLTVWSTDPAARHDVPAWARMRGHAIVKSTVLESAAVEGLEPPAEQARQAGQATPDDATTWAITVRLGG
ncbi:sulfurtransferase TusA family protein [Oerskovia turbata]